jgi:polyisoprenoid-binding protein YceI
MSALGRRLHIGPDRGSLILRTSRAGVAAQAGHDLTIEVTRWSGEVFVAEDPSQSEVHVTVEIGTLRVVSGTGGMKPLSDREKREIAQNARKILDADRHPTATFTSTKVSTDNGGGVVEGTLRLLGKEQPFHLDLTRSGEDHCQGAGAVTQSAYGIKPYTALFGALKLADPVRVEVDLDLSEKDQ